MIALISELDLCAGRSVEPDCEDPSVTHIGPRGMRCVQSHGKYEAEKCDYEHESTA